MEDNKKLFAHFTGTKDDFEKTPYPVQYEDSVVFIDGDDNEDLNCIYTHGQYYGKNIFTQTEDNGVELQSKYHFNRISIGENDCSTLSFAQGENAKSIGYASYAHGRNSTASGGYSRAYGYETSSNGNGSVAEGHGSIADGDCSHAEGFQAKTEGMFAHAEGSGTTASGRFSHAEGGGTAATGEYSHAEGNRSIANGEFSHAEGYSTEAHSNGSHAEGYDTIAREEYSHAEGYSTEAHGNGSHTEGYDTIAHGEYSHAEGNNTTTHGKFSHAEGYSTEAHGNGSRVSGKNSMTYGDYSFAHGEHLTTSNENEVAFGKYNISDENTFFTIGGGEEDNRKNILQISKNEGFYHTELNGTFNVAGRKMTHNGHRVLTSPVFITYWDLIELGKSGQLIPGQKYIITDYYTVPAGFNLTDTDYLVYTSTETHYSIIVTALTYDTLDHNAILIDSVPSVYYENSPSGNFDDETDTSLYENQITRYSDFVYNIKYITHLDKNYSEYYTMCNFDVYTPIIKFNNDITAMGVYYESSNDYMKGGIFLINGGDSVCVALRSDITLDNIDYTETLVDGTSYIKHPYLAFDITLKKYVGFLWAGRDGHFEWCYLRHVNGDTFEVTTPWAKGYSINGSHTSCFLGFRLSANNTNTNNCHIMTESELNKLYELLPDIINKRQKGVIYEMTDVHNNKLPHDFLSINGYTYRTTNPNRTSIVPNIYIPDNGKNIQFGPFYRQITTNEQSPKIKYVPLPALCNYHQCSFNVNIVNSAFIHFFGDIHNVTLSNMHHKTYDINNH